MDLIEPMYRKLICSHLTAPRHSVGVNIYTRRIHKGITATPWVTPIIRIYDQTIIDTDLKPCHQGKLIPGRTQSMTTCTKHAKCMRRCLRLKYLLCFKYMVCLYLLTFMQIAILSFKFHWNLSPRVRKTALVQKVACRLCSVSSHYLNQYCSSFLTHIYPALDLDELVINVSSATITVLLRDLWNVLSIVAIDIMFRIPVKRRNFEQSKNKLQIEGILPKGPYPHGRLGPFGTIPSRWSIQLTLGFLWKSRLACRNFLWWLVISW